MDVYFDYGCPYCLRAFAYLGELTQRFPDIELNFIPMEAHPRPEKWGMHTDLCAQGMYVAKDMGMPIWDYHTRMFRAALNDKINIQLARVLSDYMANELDKATFYEALKSNQYADQVAKNNAHAYGNADVWFLPAFRMADGRKLDAKEGVGVSYQELEAFMQGKAQ